jgi:hypothetical protein
MMSVEIEVEIDPTVPVVADDVKIGAVLANDPDINAATADGSVAGVDFVSSQANPRVFAGKIVDDTYTAISNGTAMAGIVRCAIMFNRIGVGGAAGSRFFNTVTGMDASDLCLGGGQGQNGNNATASIASVGTGALSLVIFAMSQNAAVGSARTINLRVRYFAVQVAHG